MMMKITIKIPVTMTTAVSNIVGNLCVVNVKNVVMAKNFKAVITQIVEIALGARKSQIVLRIGFFCSASWKILSATSLAQYCLTQFHTRCCVSSLQQATVSLWSLATTHP